MVNPGTYKVVNVKGGTALDLSGGDNRSIIGFNVHGQGNQQVCPSPVIDKSCFDRDLCSGKSVDRMETMK